MVRAGQGRAVLSYKLGGLWPLDMKSWVQLSVVGWSWVKAAAGWVLPFLPSWGGRRAVALGG